MGYTKDTLTTGETIVYEEKVSKAYVNTIVFLCVFNILLGLLLLIVGIGIVSLVFGVFLAFYIYSLKKGTEFVITNKRVVSKSGLIKREVIEMNIEKIESIQVHQSILGRVFNYGDVILSGAGNPVGKIKTVNNPMGFRKKCIDMMEMKR